MKKRTISRWNPRIKGIPCEIVFWADEGMGEKKEIYSHGGIWNSYIFIERENLPNRFDELIPKKKTIKYPSGKRTVWDYSPIDEKFFNMAYGATFFEVLRDEFNGRVQGIKIGNDYNHYCNQDQYITEETIKQDLTKTIDGFLQIFPECVVWNHENGKYDTLALDSPTNH